LSTNHDSGEEYGFEAEAASVNAEKEAFKLQEEEFDHSDDLLGEFLDSASKEIDNIVFFPVTNRPGDWSLEFTAVVSESEIKRYDKGGRNGKSRNAKGGDQFSNAKMCATLIAEKCIGIYKGIGPDKKQVIDGEGDPLLLNSDEFLSSMGHPNDVLLAIRKFLSDAGTATMGGAILREAGWSEDLTPLDPSDG